MPQHSQLPHHNQVSQASSQQSPSISYNFLFAIIFSCFALLLLLLLVMNLDRSAAPQAALDRTQIKKELMAEVMMELRTDPNYRGPQGMRGEKGLTGPQGPRGDQGPMGPRGEIGMVGLRGEKGSIGPQGPAGPKGPAGPMGRQGLASQTTVTDNSSVHQVQVNHETIQIHQKLIQKNLNLIQQIIQAEQEMPIGSVVAFAGTERDLSKIKDKWLLCDGSQPPSGKAYQTLRDILAVSGYMKNGRIYLPDLRGAQIIGSKEYTGSSQTVTPSTVQKNAKAITLSQLNQNGQRKAASGKYLSMHYIIKAATTNLGDLDNAKAGITPVTFPQ